MNCVCLFPIKPSPTTETIVATQLIDRTRFVKNGRSCEATPGHLETRRVQLAKIPPIAGPLEVQTQDDIHWRSSGPMDQKQAIVPSLWPKKEISSRATRILPKFSTRIPWAGPMVFQLSWSTHSCEAPSHPLKQTVPRCFIGIGRAPHAKPEVSA